MTTGTTSAQEQDEQDGADEYQEGDDHVVLPTYDLDAVDQVDVVHGRSFSIR